MIKLKDLITEAKELPKVGDNIDIVTSSYYVQKIKKVSGDYVVVDNRKGKKAPAVILGKKKDKLGLYNASFKIKINNLKKSKYQHQSTIGHTNWILKSTKGAIDGKDLEFDQMGRGKLFGFVNEGKITEKEREPSYENRNLTDLLRNTTTTLSLFETMIHRGTGRGDVVKFIRKRVSPLLTKLVKEIKKV